ncbi:MAG: homoserine kinase, partial [Mycobacteriales bacterium]
AARALTADPGERLDDAAVLELATRLEGHADNVAACLLGGLVVTWHESGIVRAVNCPISPELVSGVYVPAQRSRTDETRALLPAQVPHAHAAANAGRSALLMHALCHDPSLLLPATRDWLHQDARAAAMPDSAALIDRLRGVGIAAVLSGAGPAVLAAAPRGAYLPNAEPTFVLHSLAIRPRGATVAQVGALPGTR